VAQTKFDNTGLLLPNLGYNKIGSEGCEYLSQDKWPSLTYLDLTSNDISSEGVKHCKSNWLLLQRLFLGTFVIFRFQPNWE
jgi:hypothetical protein